MNCSRLLDWTDWLTDCHSFVVLHRHKRCFLRVHISLATQCPLRPHRNILHHLLRCLLILLRFTPVWPPTPVWIRIIPSDVLTTMKWSHGNRCNTVPNACRWKNNSTSRSERITIRRSIVNAAQRRAVSCTRRSPMAVHRGVFFRMATRIIILVRTLGVVWPMICPKGMPRWSKVSNRRSRQAIESTKKSTRWNSDRPLRFSLSDCCFLIFYFGVQSSISIDVWRANSFFVRLSSACCTYTPTKDGMKTNGVSLCLLADQISLVDDVQQDSHRQSGWNRLPSDSYCSTARSSIGRRLLRCRSRLVTRPNGKIFLVDRGTKGIVLGRWSDSHWSGGCSPELPSQR